MTAETVLWPLSACIYMCAHAHTCACPNAHTPLPPDKKKSIKREKIKFYSTPQKPERATAMWHLGSHLLPWSLSRA